MTMSWRTDGYSWLYILLNFILFILGFVFWLQDPAEVKVIDVMRVDAPYLSLLMHKYADTTVAPTKLSLETLGSYETFTKMPSGKQFGLPSTSSMTATLFGLPTVTRQLTNPQFTGLPSGTVVLASPLWAYHHNLHILDNGYCLPAVVTNAIANNIQIGVNPATAVGAAVTPGVFSDHQKCSPAYPTTVNYYQCHKDLHEHKGIFGFYSIVAMMLWIVSAVSYADRASNVQGFGNWLVPMTQNFSLIFHVIVLALLSAVVANGIPGLEDDKGACPNQQTGILMLYEIFLAVYIGIVLVVAMHIGAIIYQYHNGDAPITKTAEAGGGDAEISTTPGIVDPAKYNAYGY